MGNRSKYVAVTAAAVAAGLASARRRQRARQAMEGVRETILPTHVGDLPTTFRPEDDEAHAPGHRHLGRMDGSATTEPRGRRAWPRYAAGMGQRSPDR